MQTPKKLLIPSRLVSLMRYVQSPFIATSPFYRCSFPASIPDPQMQLLHNIQSTSMSFPPVPFVLDTIPNPLYHNPYPGGPRNPTSASIHHKQPLKLANLHTTTWDDVRETLEAVERFGRDALSKGGQGRT